MTSGTRYACDVFRLYPNVNPSLTVNIGTSRLVRSHVVESGRAENIAYCTRNELAPTSTGLDAQPMWKASKTTTHCTATTISKIPNADVYYV